jgi:hypothetical protein
VNTPSTPANVEDAIFRCYSPWARTLAQQESQWIADPVATELAAELAAELGPAQALLAWQHPISDGFIGFAEVAIRSQLRRLEFGSLAQAPMNIATLRHLGFRTGRGIADSRRLLHSASSVRTSRDVMQAARSAVRRIPSWPAGEPNRAVQTVEC